MEKRGSTPSSSLAPVPARRGRAGTGTVASLVIVGALAFFAWFAVPRIVQASVLANENSAIADLRSIARAHEAQPGPVALTELVASEPSFRSWELDGQGRALRNGYLIDVQVSTDTSQSPSPWSAFAGPINAGTTGLRAFAIDGAGRVFATKNRIASAAAVPAPVLPTLELPAPEGLDPKTQRTEQ